MLCHLGIIAGLVASTDHGGWALCAVLGLTEVVPWLGHSEAAPVHAIKVEEECKL